MCRCKRDARVIRRLRESCTTAINFPFDCLPPLKSSSYPASARPLSVLVEHDRSRLGPLAGTLFGAAGCPRQTPMPMYGPVYAITLSGGERGRVPERPGLKRL